MDNKKIGNFIAECRKNIGMTQCQLADILNVTNKAVSKWETGVGIPDVTLLPELARILGTTVDELLSGGRGKSKSYGKNKDAKFIGSLCITKENTQKKYTAFLNTVYGKRRLAALVLAVALLIGGMGLYVSARLAYADSSFYYAVLFCICSAFFLLFLLTFVHRIKARKEYSALRTKNGESPRIEYRFYDDCFKSILPVSLNMYSYEDIKAVIDADGYIVLRCFYELLYIEKGGINEYEDFIGFLFNKCMPALRFEKYHGEMSEKQKAVCAVSGVIAVLLACWQLGYFILTAFTRYSYLYDITERIVLVFFVASLAVFLMSLFYGLKRTRRRLVLCCLSAAMGVSLFSLICPVTVKTYISSSPNSHAEHTLILKRDVSTGDIWIESRENMIFSYMMYPDLPSSSNNDVKFNWLTDYVCTATYTSAKDGSLQQYAATFVGVGDSNVFCCAEDDAFVFKYGWTSADGRWSIGEKGGIITIKNEKGIYEYDLADAVAYGTGAAVLMKDGAAEWTIAVNTTDWTYYESAESSYSDPPGYREEVESFVICEVSLGETVPVELVRAADGKTAAANE